MFRTFLQSWKIQSGDQLSAGGDNISTTGFQTDTWYDARTPSTVLASLVDQGEYKDIYFGMNLNDVPKERFEQSWWYRNEFAVKGDDARAVTLLEFDGINYAANIWLNGRQVADVQDDATDSGKIGFQVHPGEEFGPMKIIVREMLLKPL